MRKIMIGLAAGLLALAAAAAILLPIFHSAAENRRITETAQELMVLLEEMEPELARKHRNIARWYNQSLPAEGTGEAYEGVLNLGEGAMGVLAAPAVGLCLPIYHESDPACPNGAVHRRDSAVPVGGQGNHTVLEGTARNRAGELMSRIGKLQAGDLIYIYVPGGPLTYVVTGMEEVSEREEPNFTPKKGQDLCSLIAQTRTPSDSGRIIVRCSRAEGDVPPEGIFTFPAISGRVLRTALTAAIAAGVLPLALRCLFSLFSEIFRGKKAKRKPRRRKAAADRK